MKRCNEYDRFVSAILNRSFRVRLGKEYGYRLVGYSGLCILLGFERANHLIVKINNSTKIDKRSIFKPQIGTTITFYLK